MTNDQKQRAIRLWCALDELIKAVEEFDEEVRSCMIEDPWRRGLFIGTKLGQLNIAKDEAAKVKSQETES